MCPESISGYQMYSALCRHPVRLTSVLRKKSGDVMLEGGRSGVQDVEWLLTMWDLQIDMFCKRGTKVTNVESIVEKRF